VAVAIALGLAAVRLLWEAGRALALIVLATALAAALAPIIERLARRMPRTAAVVLVYAAGGLLAFVLGWLSIPRLVDELQQLANRTDDMTAAVRQQVQPYLPAGTTVPQLFSALLGQFAGILQRVPIQLASVLFQILVVVFLSMYILTISPRLHWFVVSLCPPRQRRRVSRVMCRVGRAMGGYFRAVAVDAVIIGALTWGALHTLGVEFSLPLAALAAAGEFVPYIGPVIAAVPAIGWACSTRCSRAYLCSSPMSCCSSWKSMGSHRT
jgi:predicted PurR-regulated permease PerM